MNLNFKDFNALEDKNSRKDNYSKITVEPLEKGFGLTLGNALRRILLSSMPGVSVVAFKIDGVTHELMEIPGTSNDTLELISVLKKLRFEMEEDEDVIVELKFKKAGPYYAKDIKLPEGVTLMSSSENHLLLNSTGAKSKVLQLYLRKSRSAVMASEHQGIPDGFIKIDGLFSPVEKVGYEVNDIISDSKVSHETLDLFVTTDGSMSGNEAVTIAARILGRHIEKFYRIENKKTDFEIFKEKEKEQESIDSTTIEDLKLSVRSTNALRKANVNTVGHLRKLTETQLKDLQNIGKNSVKEIKEVMKKLGVSLGEY